MAKKATGRDADGNIVFQGYYEQLTIEEVGPEEEHSITIIDTNNVSEQNDFVGPRPKK